MDKRVVVKDNVIYHKNYQENVNCTSDGSKTLLELFYNNCKSFSGNPCLGTIINDALVWKSYNDVRIEVEKLSSFLNGVTNEKDIIGIFSVNRHEWIITEYASYASNCCNCPLYSTYGPDALKMVIDETEMNVCAVSGDKANLLYDIIVKSEMKSLKHVILMDNDRDLIEKFKTINVKAYIYQDIIRNQSISLRTNKPDSQDIATLCYTSGTSGNPKGVILTHHNFISTISAFYRGSTDNEMPVFCEKDVYLSYLPLAHVMERICVTLVLTFGAKVGFYRGNPKNIQADYLIIKPTFIISVPRVLNLFKEKIEAVINQKNFILRFIFNLALKYKIWRQKSGVFKSYILDKLIFNRIAEKFGGQIRSCLCGSASLNPEVLYYLQAALSIQIFQGYGQTETLAATILKPCDFFEFENVGIPFPSNKIKLERVNGYDSYSGEILVKGDNVTRGYYKREKETLELFDKDGWLKTGDIGRYYNNVFTIIGRRKEIFKTSFGEYIVPDKIELLFIGEIIDDIFISASQYADKVVAIVVCKDKTKSVSDVLQYINNKGLELVQEKKMAKYEIPAACIVLREGFETLNNGEFLTPSAKKKRALIERYYRKELDKLTK